MSATKKKKSKMENYVNEERQKQKKIENWSEVYTKTKKEKMLTAIGKKERNCALWKGNRKIKTNWQWKRANKESEVYEKTQILKRKWKRKRERKCALWKGNRKIANW